MLLSFFVAAGKLNTFKLKNKDTMTTCAVFLKLPQKPKALRLTVFLLKKNLAYFYNPGGSCLLKQQIWSNVRIKTSERSHCCQFIVFIVNFYHFLHIALVFPLLTLFFMKMYLYWQLICYLVLE